MKTLLKPLGFTLIEMLCVMLIISLLALIAFPSYMNYIYKSNRLDAHNSLFHYQALTQQCLLNTPNPEECLQLLGLSPAEMQPSLSSHYHISAAIDDARISFAAKPVLAQTKDTTCAQFLLDSLGQMTAYDDQQRESTMQCW